ncbi:MAG: VOC family protein [Bacillus sp. (in: Bacteria)]|jgi:lactoylglutathione lyase|nr:VOC family protein [Bacillus sp. (in: firmicutes)]
MTITSFNHVGIMVSDIQSSKKFYQQVLGLKVMEEFVHTNGELHLAFLGKDNQTIIELIEGYNPNLPVEGKVHHVAFSVQDIEKEKEHLQSLGVPLVWDDITTLPNGGKYLFFHGPDGEWIELYEKRVEDN